MVEDNTCSLGGSKVSHDWLSEIIVCFACLHLGKGSLKPNSNCRPSHRWWRVEDTIEQCYTCYSNPDIMTGAYIIYGSAKKWSGQNTTSPTACYGHGSISTRSSSESEFCFLGKMDEQQSSSKILAAVAYPRRGLSPFGLRLDAVVALRSYIVD